MGAPMNTNVSREVLNRIETAKIVHPHWKSAIADMNAAILAAQPGEVICLTGPSRAGKSELFAELSATLFGENQGGTTQPILTIEARNKGPGGRFTTRSLYEALLDKIEHPFYGIYERSEEPAHVIQVRRERLRESTLQAALEKALQVRGTKYLAIDEPQHIRYAVRGDAGAAAILDSWKCLASQTEIVIILIGAYPILGVLEKSPHMLGRTRTVHLQRYHGVPEDIRSFNAILKAYSRLIPTVGDGGLSQWLELLFTGSLGCVGLLSYWLRDAVAQMQLDGRDRLNRQHILRARATKSKLEVLMAEISFGEQKLQYGEDISAAEDVKRAKKIRRRPGQRSPKRYSAGGRL